MSLFYSLEKRYFIPATLNPYATNTVPSKAYRMSIYIVVKHRRDYLKFTARNSVQIRILSIVMPSRISIILVGTREGGKIEQGYPAEGVERAEEPCLRVSNMKLNICDAGGILRFCIQGTARIGLSRCLRDPLVLHYSPAQHLAVSRFLSLSHFHLPYIPFRVRHSARLLRRRSEADLLRYAKGCHRARVSSSSSSSRGHAANYG